jgi:hypothetical protein
MIFYLGQLVYCTQGVDSPAIVVGFTTIGIPIISKIDTDDKLVKEQSVTTYYLEPFKEPDKSSPSGKRIYYGPWCRRISPPGPILIKPPVETELRKEFKKVKELLNFEK